MRKLMALSVILSFVACTISATAENGVETNVQTSKSGDATIVTVTVALKPATESSTPASPGASGNGPGKPIKNEVVAPVPVNLSPANTASARPSEPGKFYTSVIIDTTGLQIDRCMSPKIRRPDGKEVWGTVKVDYNFVEDVGIVAYARSMNEALACPRCGSNPMIIRAIDRLGGNFKSDPVISYPDAELLLSEAKKGRFLEKFNVIFIKDGRL